LSEFRITYISPLVVRKELENIILNSDDNNSANNNNSSEDGSKCFINIQFIDEHPVIFWNLLWYFKRCGVDSSHLANCLLNNRLNVLRQLNETMIDKQHPGYNFQFKFKPVLKNRIILKNRIMSYHQHSHIKIKCMWDNLDHHRKYEKYDIPLYLSWLSSNEKLVQAASHKRVITVLSYSEIRSLRKSSVNPRTLETLFDMIINNIKQSDTAALVRTMSKERVRGKIVFHSIYRDLLFFILVALERERIDIDTFDNEYREVYKKLNRDVKELVKLSDKPPNNLAVWCRRLFSPLLL
jgi:DENN domain-containing protein 4